MSKDPKELDINFVSKFINKFDGNREKLGAFLNNCRNAISLASPHQQDIVLKYILSQLEGRAESACSIKEFDNWQQLEEFLKDQFGEKKHYAALLSDLQDCCQSNSETVNQFALRVETCLAKLLTEINISIPTKKKGELAGRVAAMQDLALYSFISGLNPRLSTVVRCRDPETLNEAIGFAVSEEKMLHTISKRNPSINRSHSPNHGRYPQRRFQQNRNITQKQGYPNDFSSHKPSTSGLPVCRYCKNTGHTIEECRKREFNNRFRDQINQRPFPKHYQNNQGQIHAINNNEGTDYAEVTQGKSNDDLNE